MHGGVEAAVVGKCVNSISDLPRTRLEVVQKIEVSLMTKTTIRM